MLRLKLLYFLSSLALSFSLAGGQAGVDRVQVKFTPTICKVRCSQQRCVNHCERGNVTTLFSGPPAPPHGDAFRVFVCRLLCKNGGVCLLRDRCLCPSNFTGKFCQIPVTSRATPRSSSPNEVVNSDLTRSEFLLPLGASKPDLEAAGAAAGASLVKVAVQHPPEASVKVHQVIKVAGVSAGALSGSAGAPARAEGGVRALGDQGVYAQHAGFKFCFREVKDGQCSSPLPGLRSKEMCCRGAGKAWGDCALCPPHAAPNDSGCPVGFRASNGSNCLDVNECLRPGLCQNGLCVNTAGSYSCVCEPGFILDASHGLCISHRVISEEKGQCHRVLGSAPGPSSCSLPILRNITKQICCCSRVGKAWGPDCQRCPHFGSAAFREICPAGPGYHYSASVLPFSQKTAADQLGTRGAANRQHHGAGGSEQKPRSGQPGSAAPRPAGSPPSARPATPGSAARHKPRPTRPEPTASPVKSPPRSGESRATGRDHGTVGSQGVTDGRRGIARQNQGIAGNQGSNRNQNVTGSRGWSRNPDASGDRRTDGTQATAHKQGTGRIPDAGLGQGISQSSGASPPVNQNPGNGRSQGGSGRSHATNRNRGAGQGAGQGAGESHKKQGTSGSQALLPGRGDSLPDLAPARRIPDRDVSPQTTTRPPQVQPRGACERKADVCGAGRCVDGPAGKHACVCHQGYRANAQRTHCQDVNECVASRGVCAPGECVNSEGGYRCVCPPGYKTDARKSSCQDVNECEDPLLCPGQECVNNPGSYRCVSCRPGFGLLNGVCADIDECVRAPCANGDCQNTPGGFRCLCRHGYELKNNTCADVDECAQPSQCPGQTCVNSAGSYRCVSCRPGYVLSDKQCADVNECEDGALCPGGRCVNTKGSYKCVDCRQGYRATNGLCEDVDECANASACEAERVCVNTAGSFRCDCLPGYRTFGRGRPCRDIDECLEENWCPPTGECINTPGSFTCACPLGYALSQAHGNTASCNGRSDLFRRPGPVPKRALTRDGDKVRPPDRPPFSDVDECASSDGSLCGGRERCQNTAGSYRCLTSCRPGFRADGRCHDVDECASMPGVCGSARCENARGSFVCECDAPGEHFDAAAQQCVSALPPPPEAFPVRPSSSSPGELRECYYNVGSSCHLLAANSSWQECCCTLGEGWGLGCRYHACPPAHSADFLTLCPSGRGYVTAGEAEFSYTDVDECKRFHPEVCKNGVCVNNIPGYSCYCSSGFVYNVALLECVDLDECEQESCEGGSCVNTLGSYYCSCPPPLALDDTQRKCVNASHLSLDENLSVCWQTVSAELMCQSPLLGAQVTFSDCCCLYGQGWGMECALCPQSDSDDFGSLCSSFLPAVFPEAPGREPLGTGREGGPPFFPPFSSDAFAPDLLPATDYDDYSPVGGASEFPGGTPPAVAYPAGPPRFGAGYYPGSDYEDSPPRRALGAGPPLSAPPLSSAPLPRGSPFDEEAEPWGPAAPFRPYAEGGPGRLYERRYDTYAGLSAAAEDCGILDGCENGLCIRLDEGYTCDCYHGYRLDATAMTCIDVNECEGGVDVDFPCVNSRCVNTDGSFRCVCRRGYVMSRTLNRCVPA
ncbi:LOW QUALITY PROTEIN: latent-transforming growth factor beta-binding protein 1-like [Syngnathus acus]|uniref:LOW QUALITY PROTEIN: latent-transforming growth factor beta-binding protein 1-like n=1 Tax=Syngnathus acus TaxID=161584 RepID=UPI001885D5A2|nr:LOW QUALITY PROTEIN: latent-transforming growth factor beta-binding protein 1-like [Syngnathus acus]